MAPHFFRLVNVEQTWRERARSWQESSAGVCRVSCSFHRYFTTMVTVAELLSLCKRWLLIFLFISVRVVPDQSESTAGAVGIAGIIMVNLQVRQE
jgi:hypothetical protein